MSIKITKFNKYESGQLYGFIDIAVPLWGTNLNIKGCKVFMKDGNPFITMPSREYQNDQGETKYVNLIGIDDEQIFKKFMKGVLAAWNEYCQAQGAPQAQDTEGVPF